MTTDRFKYPGVSEVFSHYTKPSYAGISLEEIIKKEEKQSYVKSRCLAIATNIFQIEEESEHNGYIQSFRKWFDVNVSQVVCTDKILFDDVNRFTGRLDIIYKNHDLNDVSLTIKTSYPSKSWALQLAAYRRLCNVNAMNTTKNIILKLSKKGDIASEFECENIEQSWEMFNNILQGWHYFKGD